MITISIDHYKHKSQRVRFLEAKYIFFEWQRVCKSNQRNYNGSVARIWKWQCCWWLFAVGNDYKLKIRECSLKYTSIKNAKRKNTEAELEADISHHEPKLERNDLSNEKEMIINKFTSKKQAFEEIYWHKTKGCIIRSRTRWYNEGEKNSKYFLNLEKRHCKSNTIGQFKTEDENTLSLDKEILTECKQFYTKL